MAGRDGDEPKEGVDFKWVKAENSNAMVRKFFTKADKAAAKAPKKAKPAAKAAPKASPKPKAKPETKGQESKTVTDKAAKIPVDTKPTSAARTRANELGMGGKDKPKEESRSTAAMAAMGALGAAVMASGRKPKPPAKPSTGTSVARNYGSIGEGKFMGRMDTEGKTRQERLAERLKQVRAQADAKAGTGVKPYVYNGQVMDDQKKVDTKKPKAKGRAGRGGGGGMTFMTPGTRRIDDMGKGRLIPRFSEGGMAKGKKK